MRGVFHHATAFFHPHHRRIRHDLVDDIARARIVVLVQPNLAQKLLGAVVRQAIAVCVFGVYLPILRHLLHDLLKRLLRSGLLKQFHVAVFGFHLGPHRRSCVLPHDVEHDGFTELPGLDDLGQCRNGVQKRLRAVPLCAVVARHHPGYCRFDLALIAANPLCRTRTIHWIFSTIGINKHSGRIGQRAGIFLYVFPCAGK